MTDTLTVIMPVRDGAVYIAEALDSILAQDMTVARVIVVDDGSVDDSAAIAARHPLRPEVLTIPAGGIGAARNRALAETTSEFVAFLDSDDLWPADHCSILIHALQADPGLAMVFGHAEQFASPDLLAAERDTVHVPAGSLPGLISGAMVARRTVFDRVGLFETDLRVAEFVSWTLRVTDAGLRYSVVPDVVLRRRLHMSNIGRHRGDDRRLDYVRAIRASLVRRRTSGVP